MEFFFPLFFFKPSTTSSPQLQSSALHNYTKKKMKEADSQRGFLNISLSSPEHKAIGNNLCTETHVPAKNTTATSPFSHTPFSRATAALTAVNCWMAFFFSGRRIASSSSTSKALPLPRDLDGSCVVLA